jgi:hypothetical protein
MNNFVVLNDNDNVAIALTDFKIGDSITIGDCTINMKTDIAFAHKIAIKDINFGEKILKYGLPIGSATKNICKGEHVHKQNIQSDYKIVD